MIQDPSPLELGVSWQKRHDSHNNKCKTVVGIRLKKLGELKAGPHRLVGVIREGILEEVTSELRRSQVPESKDVGIRTSDPSRGFTDPGCLGSQVGRSRKAASEATAIPQLLSPLPP